MRVLGISINSLPEICFAHAYSSDKYNVYLEKRDDVIEIAYIMSGDIHLEYENVHEVVPEGYLYIARRTVKEHTYSEGMQKHVTVAFRAGITDGDIILPNYALFDGKNYKEDIIKIIEEYRALQTTTLKAQSMILRLVANIADDWKKSQSNRNYGEILYIERAKRYIAANVRKKICVEDIAQAVGLSAGYLGAIFKSHMNQTIVEYVNRTRLKRVKEYMETYSTTLKQAANEFGYDDTCYVSRIYRKYFGEKITKKNMPNITNESEFFKDNSEVKFV